MTNSLSQSIDLTCPKCRQKFKAEIWLIIDAAEQTNLMEKIIQEKTHELPCPGCGNNGNVDAPLLLYRPSETPILIFSPASQTTQEQDREQADAEMERLRREGQKAYQELEEESRCRAENAPLLQMLQDFIQSETWSESQRIVQQHPSCCQTK